MRKQSLLNCDLPLKNRGFPIQATPRSQTLFIVEQDAPFKQAFMMLAVKWKGNC